jgi:putative spermidine/putrescine transport system ATP-binding protein
MRRPTRVSLEGIQKTYTGAPAPAISDLDLRSTEGEFISLLGPSGCGKTTTLRCVAGFEFPDAGRVKLDDEDITDLPPEKRDIGMVFQNYALFPHMTVVQNLAFGLEMRGIGKADCKRRIDEVLGMVQLTKMADRYPRQLSGGQQQRVALGRALVIEPRILLLDEPLANLDAVLREDMRVFIRELQRRVGITTLYVTHDQAEAMVMSDRIAVMLHGKMMQFDTPEAIYLRPRTVEVANFIGRSNLVQGEVTSAAETSGSYPTYEVMTPIGRVIASHDSALSSGATVNVTVRPEAIRLGTDGAHEGRVKSTYFLGGTVEHIVECNGNTQLVVHTSPNGRMAVGDNFAFSFDHGSPWIIQGTQ